MNIANPSKAMIALVALVCVTILLATNSVDQSAGTGLIGMIAGYAVGNGIAARRGDEVTPIIGRKS
ncbi:MAG TPA: hypothetical protein VIG24_13790 [Acidimicrobiia bacterium]|jgi:hypothetical protein